MTNKLCIIITFAIVSSIQTNDERDIYKIELMNHDIQANNLADVQNGMNNNDDFALVQVFYECLCPGSREFITTELKEVIEKIGQYLHLSVFPYGNAKTISINGNYEFNCQHGAAECYGNKLHSCAIDQINNIKISTLYNACMMDQKRSNQGSDDGAADECGKLMNIDSAPIKACAKGGIGECLLQYNGRVTHNINITYVPYVLLNQKVYQPSNGTFMDAVCTTLNNPPPPCKK